MGRTRPPWINSGAQPGLAPRASIRAPICSRGCMMRPMGRELREASPNISESKGQAASMPASSLMPVPELPQSMGRSGAAGFMATPVMRKRTGPYPSRSSSTSTLAPNCSMARRVFRQSSLHRKLSTSVTPFARPPRMAARWEMLLSPGTVSTPCREEMEWERRFMDVRKNYPVLAAESSQLRDGREGRG